MLICSVLEKIFPRLKYFIQIIVHKRRHSGKCVFKETKAYQDENFTAVYAAVGCRISGVEFFFLT